MAHFAELDSNNVVIDIYVVNNDVFSSDTLSISEAEGVAFLQGLLGSEKTFKQTSYNGSFRSQFATIGGSYDANNDVFITASPYPSWVLNTTTWIWEAPVPVPVSDDEGCTCHYMWDEDTVSWIENKNLSDCCD